MLESETLLIAVDEQDRETGVVDKMAAHRDGTLHRAFSIFVFDEADRLLLQRRATGKYHSGGLWSNTCCSHPRAGESLIDAAHRRLREEMGFDCPLQAVFGFVYRAALDGGLVEHEFDHVSSGGSRELRFPTFARRMNGSGSGSRPSSPALLKTPGRLPRGSSPPSRDSSHAASRGDRFRMPRARGATIAPSGGSHGRTRFARGGARTAAETDTSAARG